jgi:hypothetical protein
MPICTTAMGASSSRYCYSSPDKFWARLRNPQNTASSLTALYRFRILRNDSLQKLFWTAILLIGPQLELVLKLLTDLRSVGVRNVGQAVVVVNGPW